MILIITNKVLQGNYEENITQQSNEKNPDNDKEQVAEENTGW